MSLKKKTVRSRECPSQMPLGGSGEIGSVTGSAHGKGVTPPRLQCIPALIHAVCLPLDVLIPKKVLKSNGTTAISRKSKSGIKSTILNVFNEMSKQNLDKKGCSY